MSNEPVVTIANGRLRGTHQGNIATFKGIPYAAPPTGERRWRAPHPPEDWEGERDASEFAPSAWQRGTGINEFMDGLINGMGHPVFRRIGYRMMARMAPGTSQSEDCLYLNIRTPSLDPAARLPVMVWIHGGDHQDGSGSEVFYDSNVLPELGVVLVTINYRLGLLGYLCHPELTRESTQGVSGNYGTLDQICALNWVQENIARFGGDPGNVTIFGESAGGESVAHMLTSPLARGLFHKAILQSAANSRQMLAMNKPVLHHPSAEESGVQFASRLTDESDGQIARLRLLPAERLARTVRKASEASGGFYPVIDGYALPYSPFECFARGLQANVPIMVGSNADEGSVIWPMMRTPLPSDFFNGTKPAQIENLIREEFPDQANRLFELYPGLSDGTQAAQAALLGDSMFGSKAFFYVDQQARQDKPAYFYFFNQVPPSSKQTIGAFHAAEIPFVFGTASSPLFPMEEQGRALSDQMTQYWTNFARSGSPGDNELPDWHPFDTTDPQWMQLGEQVGMRPVDRQEQYEILNVQLDRWMKQLSTG